MKQAYLGKDIKVKGIQIKDLTSNEIMHDNINLKNYINDLEKNTVERGFLGNTANLNDYRYKSGVYGIYGASNPFGVIAVLEVLRYSNDWVVQRITNISGSLGTYQRLFTKGTTWSGWTKIY